MLLTSSVSHCHMISINGSFRAGNYKIKLATAFKSVKEYQSARKSIGPNLKMFGALLAALEHFPLSWVGYVDGLLPKPPLMMSDQASSTGGH